MKRVCYIIPSLGAGGTERQLGYLARGLVRDYEVTIVCTREEGALSEEVGRAGIQVRVLGGWRALGGWDLRMRAKLCRLFRSHRPDILHTFLFGFDLAANRAARDTGVPVVISSRRELATWKKGRHVRLQQSANRLVDCIVANSRAAAEFAAAQEKADRALFRVIPNGIDAEAYVSRSDSSGVRARFGIPVDAEVVGIVANFTPVKDHALFVRIADELLQRRNKVHFLLVGSGPLRGVIESEIRRMGRSERFTLVSGETETADLYSVMCISVLCSKVEGLPNVVMESMAAGKPVVAATVGGVGELIEDGVTGRLIQSREADEFARAIEGLLNQPGAARAMGERAAKDVRERFSVDAMVRAYRDLYADLLARAAGRGI